MANDIYSIISYPAMSQQLHEKGLDEVAGIVWKKAGTKVINIYKRLVNR